jgi:hypothetical protein
MRKVYEAKGKDSCRVKLNYCGVGVTINFVNGTVLNGKNAQYITDNQFVQDAIEHDSRFGTFIICTATYGDAPKSDSVSAVSHPSKPTKEVKTVKDMNGVVDWFARKGEAFSNDAELADLCEKYGVSFPNLK